MNLFDSVFSQGEVNIAGFFISLISALIVGFLFSVVSCYKSNSSKSFFLTTTLIPMCVALVIIIVNGNVGTGIAVAGAFSLVRFRSVPGTAKEICIIFISITAGLAFGMGFIAYGISFMLISGIVLFLLTKFQIFERKNVELNKVLKITIPESLDYENVFKDVLEQYTKEFKLIQVKSVNMGSMFKLTYSIVLNDLKQEKELIDDLRIRNANLEISLIRQDFTNEL